MPGRAWIENVLLLHEAGAVDQDIVQMLPDVLEMAVEQPVHVALDWFQVLDIARIKWSM